MTRPSLRAAACTVTKQAASAAVNSSRAGLTATLLVAVAVAVGLSLSRSPADAAGATRAGAPARNGLIAFMRPGKVGDYDIWVVRPNGRGLRRLTTSPRNATDYNPDWSPDGSAVLFERFHTESPSAADGLYVVSADGTGLRRLVTGCAGDCWSDFEARWSPDGGQITFIRATGPADRKSPPTKIAVYVANADGSGVRQLSAPPPRFEDHSPSWSPDGTVIVFHRDASDSPPASPTTLLAADVATGAERTVYTLPRWAPWGGLANWSRDGQQILFQYSCLYGDQCPPGTNGSRRNQRLATIRPDGTGLRVLPLKTLADSPAWSPDGKKVAFRCLRSRLCVSNLDGTGLRQFPWRLVSVHPDWGPAS
jgi:TolB protein